MVNSEVVEFLVEGVSFMAPKAEFYLEHTSSDLLTQIEDTFDNDGRQAQPVVLACVQAEEFRVFLDLLRLSSAPQSSHYTHTEWASILRLATLWSMTRLRELAIAALSTSPLNPATYISLAQRFDIPHWLGPTYSELANRPTSLTPKDIRTIGVEATMRVLRMREGLGEGEVRVVDLVPSETDVESLVDGLTESEVEELVLFSNPWDNSEVPPSPSERKNEEGGGTIVPGAPFSTLGYTARATMSMLRDAVPHNGERTATEERESSTPCVHAENLKPSTEDTKQILNELEAFGLQLDSAFNPPSTSSLGILTYPLPSISAHDPEVAQPLAPEPQATAKEGTVRQALSKAHTALQSVNNTLCRLDPSESKSEGAAIQTEKNPVKQEQADTGAWILSGLTAIGVIAFAVMIVLNAESTEEVYEEDT